jgi:hypothetical protein
MFKISSYINCIKKLRQNQIYNGLGGFCVGCDAIGVKNGPPTYQRAITKAFHEYIDVFMKIFLDDFIIFSDLSTHLKKL